MKPKRYHMALVLLHWVLALLMFIELGLGSTYLLDFSDDAPEKLLALRNHMVAGNLILILTLVRFAVRARTEHPASVLAGNSVMDRLARSAHYALYLLTVLMATSGLVLAVHANLPAVIFEGIGSLPADFSDHDARIVHRWIAKGLIALITAHILAAIYHQVIRKDRLMAHMGLGRR